MLKNASIKITVQGNKASNEISNKRVINDYYTRDKNEQKSKTMVVLITIKTLKTRKQSKNAERKTI